MQSLMRQQGQALALMAAVLLLVGLLLTAPSAQARRIDLVVPRAGADVSAYRFDSEVLGFNRSGTEVAVTGLEVARGPRGRQRGESFLLIYEANSALPLRNIIMRMLTHPDLPHNPLPLDHASDMRGALNDNWMTQWPRVPHRRHMPGDMVVVPAAVRMPAPEHGAASIHDTLFAPWVEQRSVDDAGAACSPYVGARLSFRGHTRVAPFVPLDVSASCSLLHLADKRIEWGRADAAALTMGFGFEHQQANEESARFVTLVRFEDATALTFSLVGAAPLSAQLLQHAHRVLSPWGAVVKHPPRVGAATGAGEQLVAIEAHERWLPLGQMLAQELGATATLARRHEPQDHHLITFVFGARPPAAEGHAPVAPGAPEAAAPAPQPHAPSNGALPPPKFNLPPVPDPEHEDGNGQSDGADDGAAMPPIPKAPANEPPPPRPGPKADFIPQPLPPPAMPMRRDDTEASPYLRDFGTP